MNEHQLQRLFRRVLLSLSAHLPLAVLGSACAGSAEVGGGGGDSARAGSAGMGGAIAGAGGSVAGQAGSSGMNVGGTVGDECKDPSAVICGPFTVTIPKHCVGEQQAAGALSLELCKSICIPYVRSCAVSVITENNAIVKCDTGCTPGRRPEGMVETSASESGEPGAYFARATQLEAASVTAFRILRDELRALGAPKSLVRAAGRAARDEIRHARATGALARRFGGTPRRATIACGAPRSLEAIALENAVEGCVRETYGALLATRQARFAQDPIVRAAMMRIARDETQHASLAWRVASWLEKRLEPNSRRNVERAKQRAADDLRVSLANEPAYQFADRAGLPTSAEAAQLADQMNRLLWSPKASSAN